jgi:D-glycerate 3-kinase
VSPESILDAAISAQLAGTEKRPLVLGLCGAQGSGKSTLARRLVERHPSAATLSLDDLYLPREQRQGLAATVHPLLVTRGPPGTHDVALGVRTLAALARGEQAPLPRFDKSSDDRAPVESWPLATRDTELVIFEGWCVGARPQREAELAAPVNELERDQDADGRWRRFVNAALAEPYQSLFANIDVLVLLAAPAWESVLAWRIEQEHELRRSAPRGAGVMSDAQVGVFVQHYERLTRHILAEMPGRADLVLRLDARRTCISVDARGTTSRD